MKNQLFVALIEAAVIEGYVHVFNIEEGGILKSPTIYKAYFLKDVKLTIITGEWGNLYKIITPDGIMGTLFIPCEIDIEQENCLIQ